MIFRKIMKNRFKFMLEKITRFLVFHLYYLIIITLKLYTSTIIHHILYKSFINYISYINPFAKKKTIKNIGFNILLHIKKAFF